jgi:hypothetical protein
MARISIKFSTGGTPVLHGTCAFPFRSFLMFSFSRHFGRLDCVTLRTSRPIIIIICVPWHLLWRMWFILLQMLLSFQDVSAHSNCQSLLQADRFYSKNKKFWEELIAYFPWYDTGHIINDASNNSSIVACAIVSAVTFLSSRCLATIRKFLRSRCLATIRGIHRQTHTDRQQRDLVSLLYFSK